MNHCINYVKDLHVMTVDRLSKVEDDMAMRLDIGVSSYGGPVPGERQCYHPQAKTSAILSRRC